MGLFKRILGISDTKKPAATNSWTVSGQQVSVDLSQTPELSNIGGAIRLEGNGLGIRLFVTRGENDTFYAYENKCTHMGRRLDPGGKPGSVKCCSVSGSVFDSTGNPVKGVAKKSLKTFPVQKKENVLEIDLK